MNASSTTLRFDVGHIKGPQIEQAADVLGVDPWDLALLLAGHLQQQGAREDAPEVYAAIDRGNIPAAADALLAWLEANR